MSPRRAAAADLDLPALLAAPAVATALQAHGWNGEHAHLAAGAWGPSLDLWRAKRTAKWGGRRRTADDWAADMAGWVRGETRPPAPPQKERESISAQWRRETREMQEAEARRKAAEGVVIKLADRPTKRSAS